MITLEDYVTIHLQLFWINAWEIVYTLNYLSYKVCVPNKTKDLQLDYSKYNSNQKWNNDKCCVSAKI